MNNPIEDPSAPGAEKGNGETRQARDIADLQKTITMAQIAKAAGVSQGAISSLLNDRDYGIRVSEKTRERVFKVCREMGYIPNDLRAVVRMYPELGEFCLLIAQKVSQGLSDPFVARLAQAALAAATELSHPLTIGLYDSSKEYTGQVDDLPYAIRSGVASKFLFHGPPNPSLFQQITRRGLPVISLGSDAPHPGTVSFIPDYAEASRIAVQRLFEIGHEHVGIVSGPFGSADSRIIELHRGIKAVYDQRGLPIDAQNIVYGDLSYGAGMAALDDLLTHPVKPTAIFCLADVAAAGVIARAQEQGLKVPKDLSVIGCGDDICAQLILPGLTTVHVPAEQMAAEGVKTADRLVREAALTEPRRHLVSVQLVERGSVGPRKS